MKSSIAPPSSSSNNTAKPLYATVRTTRPDAWTAVRRQHDRDAAIDGDRLARLEETAAARDVLKLGADLATAEQAERDGQTQAQPRILTLFLSTLPRHCSASMPQLAPRRGYR